MSEFEEVENMLREMNGHPEQVWAVLPDTYKGKEIWSCGEVNSRFRFFPLHQGDNVIEAVKAAYDSGEWKC